MSSTDQMDKLRQQTNAWVAQLRDDGNERRPLLVEDSRTAFFAKWSEELLFQSELDLIGRDPHGKPCEILFDNLGTRTSEIIQGHPNERLMFATFTGGVLTQPYRDEKGGFADEELLTKSSIPFLVRGSQFVEKNAEKRARWAETGGRGKCMRFCGPTAVVYLPTCRMAESVQDFGTSRENLFSMCVQMSVPRTMHCLRDNRVEGPPEWEDEIVFGKLTSAASCVLRYNLDHPARPIRTMVVSAGNLFDTSASDLTEGLLMFQRSPFSHLLSRLIIRDAPEEVVGALKKTDTKEQDKQEEAKSDSSLDSTSSSPSSSSSDIDSRFAPGAFWEQYDHEIFREVSKIKRTETCLEYLRWFFFPHPMFPRKGLPYRAPDGHRYHLTSIIEVEKLYYHEGDSSPIEIDLECLKSAMAAMIDTIKNGDDE